MNLKTVLLGALVALTSTISTGSASAAGPCNNTKSLGVTNAVAALPVGIVLTNQRYAPAFIAWVNEPYVSVALVRDPRTGRFVRVPVVLYNRRLVQVYYDRVTNVYFYIGVNGQPLPY